MVEEEGPIRSGIRLSDRSADAVPSLEAEERSRTFYGLDSRVLIFSVDPISEAERWDLVIHCAGVNSVGWEMVGTASQST
ncbi:hypothetical protein [Fimbriiglobus ruber]|uniref:Uncharacterized protein n=1 Tax=Fimbriiglobus ruber TaxID=1908690 RepID=A0A225D297_9BACT|nr:hypothetical protein [Fimbriiglobus ruber]OWK35063.1 hypothetical protein FRUB_09905 [Fimbriiglobus ruber]